VPPKMVICFSLSWTGLESEYHYHMDDRRATIHNIVCTEDSRMALARGMERVGHHPQIIPLLNVQ